MNTRLILMFLAALLMAGIAAWIAKQYIAQQAQRSERHVVTVPVVVAATEIEFGQRIEASQVRVVPWPADAIPVGALSETSQAAGKIAQRGFLAHEPLTLDRLREHLGGSALSALIKPGMRAISVRVDDVAGVAGFILPGNRVDILGTLPDKGSYTVLSGVNVLAIDQEASPEKNQPSVVHALTLEVSPHQAELLDHAGRRGPLRFTLRNPSDQHLAPSIAPVARPAPVAADPTKLRRPPSVMMIDWKNKGQVSVERCNEWPCAPGGQAKKPPALPVEPSQPPVQPGWSGASEIVGLD